MKQFKLNKIGAVSMMIFCLTIVLGTINNTYAAVIGFEEIYPVLNKSNTNSMPANYTGFNWSGTFRLMTKEYAATGTSGVGYRNGMIGNVAAYTSGAAGANKVEMSSVNPFDFTGAHITSAWKMNQDVLVQGYSNGQLIYAATIITSSDRAYWFDFDFRNINRLCIIPGNNGTDIYSNYRGNHLAIDNITTIPEPATLILVCLGGLLVKMSKRED